MTRSAPGASVLGNDKGPPGARVKDIQSYLANAKVTAIHSLIGLLLYHPVGFRKGLCRLIQHDQHHR